MGSVVDIELRFAKEKHARWAAHVVEGLIKLSYAPIEGFDVDPETTGEGLSDLFLRYDDVLRSCDPGAIASDSSLGRMRREGTRIILDRCHDVQWRVTPRADEPDDFFTQLCFALVRRFPQVRFVAYARYEMTVSGEVERTRASWNAERLQFRQIVDMRPLDENAWDTWDTWDWALCDGQLKRCEAGPTALQQHCRALLADAREAAAAGDTYAALRFVDDARALPHCDKRLEVLLCRAEVGKRLRRRAVKDFVWLMSRDAPAGTEGLSCVELTEMPLDVGTHVLRREGEYVRDVDTADGTVQAEVRILGAKTLYLVDGQYLLDDEESTFRTWYLIEWDYE